MSLGAKRAAPSWVSFALDILIVVALWKFVGTNLVSFLPGSDRSTNYFAWVGAAGVLFSTIGFFIVGVRTTGHSWRYLAGIALCVWIAGVAYTAPASSALISSAIANGVVVAATMALGGGAGALISNVWQGFGDTQMTNTNSSSPHARGPDQSTMRALGRFLFPVALVFSVLPWIFSHTFVDPDERSVAATVAVFLTMLS